MKTDWVHRAVKWLDHNRYVAVAILLIAAVAGWTVGCRSTTGSIILNKPGKVDAVTLEQQVATVKQELTAEKAALDAEAAGIDADRAIYAQTIGKAVADHNAKTITWNARTTEKSEQIDLARADLAAQDAMKQQLVATIGQSIITAAKGGIDPANTAVGLVSLASILLGGGALFDNRRKDSLVVQLKAENAELKNGSLTPPKTS